MGKLLPLILLVAVYKCNGQFFGGYAQPGRAGKQFGGVVNSGLGLASSIFGGLSSGIGFNGQVGFNTQMRPGQNYNNQYPNTQQNIPEETQPVENDYQQYQPPRPKPPGRPQHSYNNNGHRPKPPHNNRPGYGNQGQQQGNPNNGYNNFNNNPPPPYNENVRPPGQNNGGNYNNNNQNYGNTYPGNQNFGNNPGYNGFNNNGKPNNNYPANPSGLNNNQFNQNGPERPIEGNSQNNKPGYGNNNDSDYNQDEVINQIFGTPQKPNTGLNSGTLNPSNSAFNSGNQSPNNGGLISGSQNGGFGQNQFNQNTGTEKPKETFPAFVPLSSGTDEDFEIDIRNKDQ